MTTKATNQQRLVYCFVAAVFIAVAVVATMAFLKSRNNQAVPVKSMDTWQQADAPLGYPLSDGSLPPFDSRFLQLSAFERALIPTITRMEQPMGSTHGALTYNAQPYWANNKKRGGHHTGDDINGIGGMNTDLGDPIYAASNGLVIYRGEPSPGWGNTLITAHRAPDGSIYQVMYSHLQRSSAALGEMVSVGEPIGTVGTANLNYPAHLHLEMRDSTGVWIGRGYLAKPAEHLDPTKEIHQLQTSPQENLYQSPFLIAKRERIKRLREAISIKNATKEAK